ncbi:unnamed protein product [Clavelina lepadiformis]|uniref:Uncharacterized protein n=1 Tax=Clavelina lepadiformis TaxID=159417 RepID=A0ABP0FSG7_CLALP
MVSGSSAGCSEIAGASAERSSLAESSPSAEGSSSAIGEWVHCGITKSIVSLLSQGDNALPQHGKA